MSSAAGAEQSFEGALESAGPGGEWTVLPVPPEVVRALGGRKRVNVAGTMGGAPFQSALAVLAGQVILTVTAQMRAAAGVRAGDRVEVTLRYDLGPRVVALPDVLVRALEDRPGAKERFAALGYEERVALATSVSGAGGPDERRARAAEVAAHVAGGSLTDGTPA